MYAKLLFFILVKAFVLSGGFIADAKVIWGEGKAKGVSLNISKLTFIYSNFSKSYFFMFHFIFGKVIVFSFSIWFRLF